MLRRSNHYLAHSEIFKRTVSGIRLDEAGDPGGVGNFDVNARAGNNTRITSLDEACWPSMKPLERTRGYLFEPLLVLMRFSGVQWQLSKAIQPACPVIHRGNPKTIAITHRKENEHAIEKNYETSLCQRHGQ
jgi:hypothetical protein